MALVGVVAVCSSPLLLATTAAHADVTGDAAAAGRAFQKAQAAELTGDMLRAARMYMLAHSIVPSAAALRSACRARYRGGDHVGAATTAMRLRREYPKDARATKLATEILALVSAKLGLIKARCTPACTLSVEGLATGVVSATRHVIYAKPGRAAIVAFFGDGRRATASVEVRAGARATVELSPAPRAAKKPVAANADPARPSVVPPPEVTPSTSTGVRRRWFAAAAVGTVALAGIMTWSAVQVVRADERYEQDPTFDRWQERRSLELRTNVLIGAAATAAIGTATLAYFTNWSPGRRTPDRRTARGLRVELAPQASGFGLTLAGVFP